MNYNSNNCFPYEEHECNPRWPHKVVIYRKEEAGGNPWENPNDTRETVLYEGMGRSYRKSMTGFRDHILTNTRMVSIKGAVRGVKVNDIVKIEKGHGYTEKGYVKDVNIYMNGRGTTIEWDYERV